MIVMMMMMIMIDGDELTIKVMITEC
jgi:hypothetical protein